MLLRDPGNPPSPDLAASAHALCERFSILSLLFVLIHVPLLLGSVLVPLLGFLLVLPLLVRRFLHSTPTAGELTAIPTIHPSPPPTVPRLPDLIREKGISR